MSYDTSLEERIISDIDSAFETSTEPFVEYDLIPHPESTVNSSPVIVENRALGLQSWCLRRVFAFAYHRWSHEWLPLDRRFGHAESVEVLSLTRVILLINPECYTAWNHRKRLTISGELQLTEDISLNALVLTKHPKSPETFSHRKYLLGFLLSAFCQERQVQYKSPSNLSVDTCLAVDWTTGHRALNNLITMELSVCTMAAEKYPSNYNAWSHRVWFIQKLQAACSALCFARIMYQELNVTTKRWTDQHISDHSGYAYRQFLLKKLNEIIPNSTPELVKIELAISDDMITRYPDHEALWNHRRFIVHLMSQIGVHLQDIMDDPVVPVKVQKTAVQSHTHDSRALVSNYVKWKDKFIANTVTLNDDRLKTIANHSR